MVACSLPYINSIACVICRPVRMVFQPRIMARFMGKWRRLSSWRARHGPEAVVAAQCSWRAESIIAASARQPSAVARVYQAAQKMARHR